MSVSNAGASTGAYAYLQSLLPPQQNGSERAGAGDPVSQLLDAFYPTRASTAASATGDAAGSTAPESAVAGPPFSPDTMSALMSAQEQHPCNPIAARAGNLFAQFDADGDGQVSKSEFETVFGSDADMSKVDGLFNALDSNGDGSMSLDELTSAVQASHAHHHGHQHHRVDSGARGDGGMLRALLNSGTQGASADTASNADGSSTTTITYADGSKVSLTSAAGSGGEGSSSSGSGNDLNVLERLIRLQAQSLTVSTGQSLASV